MPILPSPPPKVFLLADFFDFPDLDHPTTKLVSMRFSSSLPALVAIKTIYAATHNIAVGQDGLAYTPNTTYADIGDTVIFSFYPIDHNVVQGPFETPCLDGNGTGIYSGFIGSSEGVAVRISLPYFLSTIRPNRATQNRTFQITINDTNPIWFYCSQKAGGGHCTKGMVGVINPPHGCNQTLAQYAASASSVSSTSYTEPKQVQLGIVLGNTAGNNTSVSTTSSRSATPSATDGFGNYGGSGGSGGSATSTASGAVATKTNGAHVINAKSWKVGAVAGGLALAFL
jgi:plastocyanin